MTDIVAFLRDRLDAEEEAVRKARLFGDQTLWLVTEGDVPVGLEYDSDAELRQIAARRRVVNECGDYPGSWMDRDARQLAVSVLRSLAAPYSRHPDFDPGWSAVGSEGGQSQ